LGRITRTISLPPDLNKWVIENCYSPSRILQRAIREMMQKEKKNQEGKK